MHRDLTAESKLKITLTFTNCNVTQAVEDARDPRMVVASVGLPVQLLWDRFEC